MYQRLNLSAWPFQVVPDEDFAKMWAGRKETKKQIDHLLWKMQFVPKSSLRLLWANFGMGKTHTLLHIKHLCEQTNGKLVPVYAVMPNKPRGFLDVYRAIVAGLPFEYLGDQLVQVGNASSGSLAMHPMFTRSPGIVNALLAMRSGDLERRVTAQQWISAQPGLTARDLRTIGVTYRIKTAEDAIHALTALTQLATFGIMPVGKLVILLDEYQRIGELKPAVRNQINAGIHGFFNANPAGVEIILTFSFGKQENVTYLLSDEIKSRAELQAINLDVLSETEAVEFLRDLLQLFRVQPDERWAYPFTPDALNTLVIFIAQHKALTPRRIMHYANFVLLDILSNRSLEDISEITRDEITARLTDSRLSGLDMDDAA